VGILLLTSTAGSPGTTTLAVGLALTWPRPVLLVDADPGAHQAILAGYLTGRGASGKGLLRVAEAHRDRRSLREVVIDQTLPLADGDTRRLFLPGFARAGSANHFGPVWEDLAETFDRLDDVDFDVIVDCGRLGSAGPPGPLVERSAVMAVVLTSSLRSVMSARVHLPVLQDQGRSDRGRLGLIVVGEGQPYGRGEIAKALQLPVLSTIVHDPKVAGHLSDGRPRVRRFESSALIRGIRDTAIQLADGLQRSADAVRSGS
jgi:hypothetical protein